MSVSFAETSFADKGGVPNDNAQSGPACQNADDGNNRHNDLGIDQGGSRSNHNNKDLEYTCLF
jgi:hypothetical protein